MGKKLLDKFEFEMAETLHKGSVKDHSGNIVAPEFYVPISLPVSLSKKLGYDAVDSGYKPGEKVHYKIIIERFDDSD